MNCIKSSVHQLITSVSVSVGDIQGSTIIDNKTPKEQGKYIFESVWRYILNIESSSAINELKAEYFNVFPNPSQAGNHLR